MAAETELDPVIHAPARLRVLVTLAILRDGESLSFTRLQELLGLTPGNLIIHLHKLEDAGYVTTVKTGSGVTARTSVSLSQQGRPEQLHSSPVLRQLEATTSRSRKSRPIQVIRHGDCGPSAVVNGVSVPERVTRPASTPGFGAALSIYRDQ